MQDYYSRYLPQMYLAGIIPIMILIAIFPFNWAAALILFVTAPLIPIFMALVGLGAADANRRNFIALVRLSGSFLDRLRVSILYDYSSVKKQKFSKFVSQLMIFALEPWKYCGCLSLFWGPRIFCVNFYCGCCRLLRVFIPW